MFISNEYSPKSAYHLNQLKSDIDRKIDKISYMIKQKYKQDKSKYPSSIIVKHIGVQTLGQYHLSSFTDSLLIDNELKRISNNDYLSTNKINSITQTYNNSDNCFNNKILIGEIGTKQDTEQNLTSCEDIQQCQESRETKNIKTNKNFDTGKQIIKQQSDQAENSFDISKDNLLEQDKNMLHEQQLKQSLIMSISSDEKQKQNNSIKQTNKLHKPIVNNYIMSKKPITSPNKTFTNYGPRKKSIRKQPVPKFTGKSIKKQSVINSEELTKKKQKIKEKIIQNKKIDKKTKNIKTEGSILDNDELYLNIENFNSPQSDIRSQCNIRPNKTQSFKKMSSNTFEIRIATKNNLKLNKSSEKLPSQKVIVKPQIKEKMKFLISQMTPRDRRQDHDSTIRSNLLKRIEERNKITKN